MPDILWKQELLLCKAIKIFTKFCCEK